MEFDFEPPVGVVGLGYVGLPLALELGKIMPAIGYDIRKERVQQLSRFIDSNGESSPGEIREAKRLTLTSDPVDLRQSRFLIVAVPTPVTSSKQPDFSFVESAARTVGQNLRRGSIVVFEPTVYPGATEEICVPILEKESGLRYMDDFKVGYSPERINPGDREHALGRVVKIVSGCDAESLAVIASVYEKIVKAGVYRAASIRTAEAAKVLENVQRDLNIALMNEVALICHRMGVDTNDVLEAAGTKWNFMKFYPGLVGGHCIGVDPYYLTYKAELLGYHPEVILSGRRVNDLMGKYIAERTVKLLIEGGKTVKGAKVVVLGITFKENVSDIRNSRVIDLVRELSGFGVDVQVCDPLADARAVKEEYGISLSECSREDRFDAVVLAVSHAWLRERFTVPVLKQHLAGSGSRGVVVDVKGMFCPADFASSGLLYWRL